MKTQKQKVKIRIWQVILGAFSKLRKATISLVMSACLSVCLSFLKRLIDCHWTNLQTIRYLNIFFLMSRKFKFDYNLIRKVGTLREYLCTFMIISRSNYLGMRKVTGKCCRENQNTYLLPNNFFSPENRVACETM
jgi:hypothetical protein